MSWGSISDEVIKEKNTKITGNAVIKMESCQKLLKDANER